MDLLYDITMAYKTDYEFAELTMAPQTGFLRTQQITEKHQGQYNNSCLVRRSRPCVGLLILRW